MKIIKPLSQGLMYRFFEHMRKHYLVVGSLQAFHFGNTPSFLTEPEMWTLAKEELGEGTVLDLGMLKPRAEVLVHGYACAPAGEKITGRDVRLRMASLDKTVRVFGDRHWTGGHSHTDPIPFEKIPLDFSRAFGGENYKRNPIGRGAEAIQSEAGKVWPMPNLEYPQKEVTGRDEKAAPVSFGPLDIAWPQRTDRAGTYDEKWLKERFPGLADDIDWAIYNAAPEDQWFPAFLKGNESFILEGMHPEQERIESALPTIRPRVFIKKEEQALSEVTLRCDTVWLFPHREIGIVAYRGLVPIATEDADEIKHVVLGYEWLRDAPRPVDHYAQALAAKLNRKGNPKDILDDSPLLPEGEFSTFIKKHQETLQRVRENPSKLILNMRNKQTSVRAEVAANLKEQGLDPDALMPPAAPPPEIPDPLDINPEAMRAAAKKEMQAQQERANEILEQICKDNDLDPAVIRKEQKTYATLLPQIDVAGMMAALQSIEIDDPEAKQTIAEAQGKLEEANRKVHSSLRFTAHQLPEATPPTPEEQTEMREKVKAAMQGGKSLAGVRLCGAQLAGLDLSGLDLTDTILLDADLTGATFDEATLTRTVFARANLTGAHVSGATVSEASFAGATLRDADFTGLDLTGCLFDNAKLAGAIMRNCTFAPLLPLTGCDATEIDFSGATLTKVVWTQTNFTGATFSGATLQMGFFKACMLQEVNFSAVDIFKIGFVGCQMQRARFTGATCEKAIFTSGTDLTDADFSGATVNLNNFFQIDLPGAIFRHATCQQTGFMQCNMQGANFDEANGQGALMMKSDLTGATLQKANLMKARLRASILTQADFTGANLFAADLMRTTHGNTKFDHALLKRTILEHWRPA